MCLSCTAASKEGERVGLAAEGFGNRMCFLQSFAQKVNIIVRVVVTCIYIINVS